MLHHRIVHEGRTPGSVRFSHSWEEVSDGGPDRRPVEIGLVPPSSPSTAPALPAAIPLADKGALTSRLVISITILNTGSGTVF
jgi:hypothetical protein